MSSAHYDEVARAHLDDPRHATRRVVGYGFLGAFIAVVWYGIRIGRAWWEMA